MGVALVIRFSEWVFQKKAFPIVFSEIALRGVGIGESFEVPAVGTILPQVELPSLPAQGRKSRKYGNIETFDPYLPPTPLLFSPHGQFISLVSLRYQAVVVAAAGRLQRRAALVLDWPGHLLHFFSSSFLTLLFRPRRFSRAGLISCIICHAAIGGAALPPSRLSALAICASRCTKRVACDKVRAAANTEISVFFFFSLLFLPTGQSESRLYGYQSALPC